MRRAISTIVVLALSWSIATAADTFDELAADMSVARNGNVVVATRASQTQAARYAQRFSAYDAQIHARYFPSLESFGIRFIVGDDVSGLARLASAPAADTQPSTTTSFGYYIGSDRLIVASTARGDAAVLRELTRALVRADNPNAPRWFETAMASLYESSELRDGRLVPVLDDRMARIPADEDLDYDVFAGICDCSPVTANQLALIRLLMIHLDRRGQLAKLCEVVKRKGPYLTLLESLEAMGFDREAWKAYAQRSVRAFWNGHKQDS